MGETHDAMRAIRSKDYKLIHNLMPERAWCQYSGYKEGAYPMLAAMNVMNLKGQLTPEQAIFMAPRKPEFELFDLRDDPHELKNLSGDPKHVAIQSELLAELEGWRKNVIHDQGVSVDFRAEGVFPESCPDSTVDEWVAKHAKDYDFIKSGLPAWYPTRTLEEWEKAQAIWEPYVFRDPAEIIPRPATVYSAKKKKGQKSKGKGRGK